VKYPGRAVPDSLARPVEISLRDYRTEKPVSDSVFRILQSSYSYDRSDLKAAKAESNNKLDKCLRRAYSKVDDQVHARAVCFGSGKAMVEGIPHVE